MKRIKVGIIGCGTIGSAVAKIVSRDFRQDAIVSYLSEINKKKAQVLKQEIPGRVSIVSNKELIRKSDLVVEAASAFVASRVAKRALAQNKQVLIISVGGLLVSKDWQQLVAQRRGRLWAPSGAVAGIDGLLASRESGIKRVTLITRKPPSGLRGAPYFRRRKFPVLRTQKACCLFRGSARQAVRAFPQNVNVAAMLSLAGIGAEKTRVEVWTSRADVHNKHEVFIESRSGTIRVEIKNVPSAFNPKTSALAVYSTVATLRKIFSSFRLGT